MTRLGRGVAIWLGILFATVPAVVLPSAPAQGQIPAHDPALDPSVLRMIFARPTLIPAPETNSITREKVLLGRALFHDRRLSGDGTRSCASCHKPALAFTDGMPRALSKAGEQLRRNTPHLYNLAWGNLYYWDGRADSLEAQARVPILAPDEMGGDFASMTRRLAADLRMRHAFARAFPGSSGIRDEHVLAAIASYERTLVSPPTRFDRFVTGDRGALSAEEREGLALFMGRGQCVTCHGGWRFTDDKFHDIGLGGTDPGRSAIPGGLAGLSAFKTPSLRLVARTAPYMHDGSRPTLSTVVDHYSDGIVERPGLAVNVVRELRLATREKRALIAFLRTL